MSANETKETEITGITLFIRSFFENTYVFTVNKKSTVGDLKSKINKKLGCNVNEQILRFGKTLLKNDDDTIEKYGIINLSNLNLSAALKGGSLVMPAIIGPDMSTPMAYKPLYNVLVSNPQITRPGLNLRFEYEPPNVDTSDVEGETTHTAGESFHNWEIVTGTMGFGVFDIARHYRRAYCQHYRVYCPSLSKVRQFEFVNCVVTLEGELYESGEVITKTCKCAGRMRA